MVFHVFHGHACAWFHVVHGHSGFCFHVHGGSCFPLSCMVVHVFQHAGGASYSSFLDLFHVHGGSCFFIHGIHAHGVSCFDRVHVFHGHGD